MTSLVYFIVASMIIILILALVKKMWRRFRSRIISVLVLLNWRLQWLRKVRRHDLPVSLTVSLTSYPPRFRSLHLTIKCLLNQTVSADRVILWVASSDKNDLPENVVELQKYGLIIKYCDDIKSYKKIIPVLNECESSFIVTADDDVWYWRTWLEGLVGAYAGNSKETIAYRCHRIRLGGNGSLLPYNEWDGEINKCQASSMNFPTGIGGVLYPPKIFHEDVTNEDLFIVLCPTADDVWLYWMVRLNGGSAKCLGVKRPLITWHGSQESALYIINVVGGGNDAQIYAMMQKYGLGFNDKY